jgi:acetoin utilization deacetylase AcuC-like enzyme
MGEGTTDGFRRAGEAVGGFVGRIGILQEGGYACPELGKNLAAFLEAVDG